MSNHHFIPYRAAAGASYDSDAQAVFNAMATEPDATRKGHINTLVTALKSAGIWTLLDHFVVMANTASADGLLDWKNPSTPFTLFGSASFVSDRGHTLGATGTNYIKGPTNMSALTNYQQDAAHIAIWSRTAAAASGTAYDWGNDGGATNFRGRIRASDNAFFWNVNGVAADTAITDGSGMLLCTRPNSTTVNAYRNGSAIAGTPDTGVSSAPPAFKPTVGWNNTVYAGSREFALFAIGGDVTSSQSGYYDAVSAYMTAVGAA